MSYFGIVTRTSDKLLLGGVPQVKTSRFMNEEDARSLVNTILEANRDDGRPCEGFMYQTVKPSEILRCSLCHETFPANLSHSHCKPQE